MPDELQGQKMLYFSLFLAGFTLGVFASLKIFTPEKREETWDPQHFPVGQVGSIGDHPVGIGAGKPSLAPR